MTKTQTGTLLRVLNNNAVMVDAAGDRVILLGRGIGFGKRLGDAVDLEAATESFSPSTALELRQLADFAREIPLEVFRVARRAVDHAETAGDVRPWCALR
ncbi:CAT RNA binding domain-containing protein, partial [Kocuria palustris]|uniref:CAT RNA binding domain-containing protein n=1 Tax=Kocuria palustris TaxID=71999 RepID=UPI000ABDACF3